MMMIIVVIMMGMSMSIVNSFPHRVVNMQQQTRSILDDTSRRGSGSDDVTDMSNDLGRKGMKGYYRRPSRAIEKGGGFFIPGFENERIRILSSTVLLVLLIVNRSGVQVATFSQIVTELTGAVMIILLFLQGIADRFKIDAIDPLSVSNTSNYITTIQKDKSSPSIDTVESIARAIVQTSPDISYILVLSKDNNVLLELSPISTSMIDGSSSSVLGASLRAQQRVSIDGLRKVMASTSWKLNDSIQNVVNVIDSYSGVWLVGSNRSSDGSNVDWIKALIGCPLQQ